MLRPIVFRAAAAARPFAASTTTTATAVAAVRPVVATAASTTTVRRHLGGSHHDSHHVEGGAGPNHPVVPGSVGNKFEDRYWPAADNVYRPPSIPRTTHYSMDHDLYFDDDVRPEPLIDNHNIGLSNLKMLAQLGVGLSALAAAYVAANFYGDVFMGPSPVGPRRMPYDGLRQEHGGLDDRNYGHGEGPRSSVAAQWLTIRSGDPYLAPGEEKEVAAFAAQRAAQRHH